MTTYHPPQRQLLVLLLCQAMGFALGLGIAHRYPHLPPVLALTAHSLAAGALCRFAAGTWSWVAVNLALPFALALSAHVIIPPTLLAAVALTLLFTYLPTLWTGVPLYTTHRPMVEAIANELPTDRPFTFIDLGSGTGWLLARLAELRPNGVFIGYEVSPLPACIAALRLARFGKNRVSVRYGDFWQHPLSDYDFVYAFLAPPPMVRIWRKAQREMRAGSVFLSNNFHTGEIPSRVVTTEDSRSGTLFIHEI